MPTEYRNLIAAVIRQIVKDWQQCQGSPSVSNEYFDSEEFCDLVEAVGLYPRTIKAKILANQFDARKLRAAYR